MNRSLQSIDAALSASRLRTGLALAGATALVSGISVFVNASAVRAFDDPVLYTTLKNGVAASLLLAMALAVVRGPWITRAGVVPGLVALGILGGSVPFVLFFTGLAEATAPAAAVIHKTLFVWVAILAVLFLGERLGRLQVMAIGVLLASQLLIQTPTGVGWGAGETLIAAATAFWAVEIIVAKRVLVDVRSPVAAAARMGIGLVLLVVFLGFSGGLDGIGSLGAGTVGMGADHRRPAHRLRGHLVRRPAARSGERGDGDPDPRSTHHGCPSDGLDRPGPGPWTRARVCDRRRRRPCRGLARAAPAICLTAAGTGGGLGWMDAVAVDHAPAAGPAAAAPGPVLFARYAYPPNRLGLCGPDDAPSLQAGALAGATAELRELARGFEGAYPYLSLIAQENGIADPLDRRVVEAYWLGGDLSARIAPRSLHRNVNDRFRGRMTAGDWRWLERALAAGSRPIHAFHVLEIFPRAGLMRGDSAPILETIDSCRVRWGRLVRADGDQVIVSASRLELVDGALRIGGEGLETVTAWYDGHGLLGGARPGDPISLHWGWACDRLSASQLRRLVAWTDAALRVTNQAI